MLNGVPSALQLLGEAQGIGRPVEAQWIAQVMRGAGDEFVEIEAVDVAQRVAGDKSPLPWGIVPMPHVEEAGLSVGVMALEGEDRQLRLGRSERL